MIQPRLVLALAVAGFSAAFLAAAWWRLARTPLAAASG
jgi:hypothetical protein